MCQSRLRGKAAAIFALHRRVPIILHGVVACSVSLHELRISRRHTATREFLGNFGPFRPDLGVITLNGFLLLGRERRLVENGIDMIVPSLTTLLAGTASEARCDDDPFLGAEFVHQGKQATIFRRRPGSLDGLGSLS